MIQDGQLLNYVGGTWKRSRASDYLDVRNPATAETIVQVPLSSRDEVDEAVRAAQAAFVDWRRTPPTERIQYLFKLKKLLEYHFDDIARRIDEHMLRQPVGVVAAITPFNFPGMIPLWFMPYAIACGNCFILKPSEKV